MTPIGAISDLPFVRRDVLDLLNLRHHRAAPDPDYTGFGHARVDALQLEGDDGQPVELHEALVIAVHSMEEPEEMSGDIDLEFILPETSGEHSVTVLLSAFLRVWLPLVRGDERAIVLVVCNPNQTLLRAPPSAGRTPFYYPLGDVESWLQAADDHQEVRLVARSWRRAEGEHA